MRLDGRSVVAGGSSAPGGLLGHRLPARAVVAERGGGGRGAEGAAPYDRECDAGSARSVISWRRCVNFRAGIGSPDRGGTLVTRCPPLVSFRAAGAAGLGCTFEIGGRPLSGKWPTGYSAFISMNAERRSLRDHDPGLDGRAGRLVVTCVDHTDQPQAYRRVRPHARPRSGDTTSLLSARTTVTPVTPASAPAYVPCA